MDKIKTSIYIDKTLWDLFKKYAVNRGIEISKLIEELIENEILDYTLDDVLLNIAGSEVYEIDFEPIEIKKGTLSELIREMRDERRENIFR